MVEVVVRAVLAAVLALGVACGPPDFVDGVDKIDGFLARGQWEHACVGLRMRDVGVRLGTAERVVKYASEPVLRDCLCEALVSQEANTWDPAVAEKLTGTRHAAGAECLLSLLETGKGNDRIALAAAVVAVGAPEAGERLQKIVRQDADAGVRAAALSGLQGAPDALALAVDVLASDPDAAMRAAAVSALAGRAGPEPKKALLAAVKSDADPAVRSAALRTLGKLTDVTGVDVACAAMTSDVDPGVRAAAAGTLAGTTVGRAAACLAKRLGEEETDGSVREALLAAARTSPHVQVNDALCKQIGPWLKRYIKDDIASRIPGFDIVEAQNNADWRASYACVEKALSQPGLSCYARNYLAHWFQKLGGKAKAPWCPGMMKKGE